MPSFRELFFQEEESKPTLAETVAAGIVRGLISGNYGDAETKGVIADLTAYSNGDKPAEEWSASSIGLKYIENLET